MLIINDNQLLHTDSTDDVLEHFGVKGMKWGNRRSTGPKVGQFSGRIKKNLVSRNSMKRANEKKIAGMKKSDPKRRELINKNKDLTDMNQKALLRLDRNKTVKKVAGKTAALGVGAAAQYQIMKTTNPEAAAALKRFVKGGAKAATKFAKKNYHKAKYAAGYVAKRSYL
jgi:hypothetical protein|uniref:Uncharacterized protein n=2 Tax=unclassified Caudoviricetes TaxID=2788787 RepID=A0A8S5LUD4_9CAUD|nr:MAG TPA: hypothetical protein [Siphoviridae sp. ctKm44]DAE09948.1 MAG TPA: hypothetical protein [Siphoviridae sp. ctJdE31]